ncbi:MAG: tetraacyldisaccharide 4'-kinase [Candidatus Omnitrophota bacterium]
MKKYFYSLATDQKNNFFAIIIKVFLYIFSLIYGVIVFFNVCFYKISIFRSYKLNCVVISVGNITWGGTGKTPFLIELSNYLKNEGHKIAILTRGYKSYKNIGDETALLKNNLKDVLVISGKNRLKNALIALKEYSIDTIILDDGFQHYKIARDLDIVLLDSTNPFGNKNLIPRGILREPISSLKRAHIFLLTKVDLVNQVMELEKKLTKINPKAMILESRHAPIQIYDLKTNDTLNLDILKNKNICSLSAVASPESFTKTLENLKAKIILDFSFLDHHEYSLKEIENIIKECRNKNIDTIVTTQKDAIKLKDFNLDLSNIKIFVLKIKLEITENKEKLYDELLSLYIR